VKTTKGSNVVQIKGNK